MTDETRVYMQLLEDECIINTTDIVEYPPVAISMGETTIDFDYGYDLAVSLEKDAILFLIEIKTLMPQAHHETIDTLIEEERAHLKFLYKYMEGDTH